MKKTGKLLSMVLALALVFALALPALAATTTTITITGSNKDATYSAYRLLNLTTSEKADKTLNYAYTVNGTYRTILKAVIAAATADAEDEADRLPDATDAQIIDYISAANPRDFAEAVFTAINKAELSGDKTATAKNVGTDAAPAYEAVFSGIAQGYYLIAETSNPGTGEVASLVMLDTAGQNAVEITSKNDAMAVDKKVNGKDTYETYNIGDTVPFTITSSLPRDLDLYTGNYTYVFHDTMSAGLTYTADSMKVKVNNVELTSGQYTLTVDGTAITIDLSTYITANKASLSDKSVAIDYKATLNTNAVVNSTGNPNEVYLQFSNNYRGTSTGVTAVDEVVVYTYEAQVVKYTDSNANDRYDSEDLRLADAYFVITRTVGEEGNRVTQYAVANSSYVITGWKAADNLAAAIADTEITKFVSSSTGDISVKGLDAGSYKLIETAAPDGYNLLAEAINFAIAETNGAASIPVTYVENNTGAELPSTGGMGTTVFYVVGGLLMTCAAVLLVAKKKMSREH